MESPFAKPEHRPIDSYIHPERAGLLFEYAIKNRVELVYHALRLFRAYIVAGKPNPLKLGTFEHWAELIPSAIFWASEQNPLDCRPSQSGEESPDDTFARIMVQQWSSFCAASSVPSVSAAQVISALYPKGERGEIPEDGWGDFRGAIEHWIPTKPGQTPSATVLAKIISRRFKVTATVTQDPPAPLQRFVADGLTHGRQRWRIEDVTNRSSRNSVEKDPDDPESY